MPKKLKAPKLPKVVYPGGLTAREHAIINARQWQITHGLENIPVPTEAYTIIVDLLGLLPYEEVCDAIARMIDQ